MTTKLPSPARRVLANRDVLRLIGAHLLTVITEWAFAIGLLVHAFDRGGPRATGITSVLVLAPALVGAPLVAALTDSVRPLTLRRSGFALQTVGFALTAVSMAAGLPLPVTIAAGVVALGAVTLLRPTGAALLPATVRSSGELTLGSLWISYCESSSALLGPLAAAGLLALGGPTHVVVGCGAMSLVAFVVASWPSEVDPPSTRDHVGGGVGRPFRVLGSAFQLLQARPRNTAVLAVSFARNLLVGAFDVLLVVLAFDQLDLGASGPGLLASLVGAGAFLSSAVVARVAPRGHLTPILAVGLAVAGVLCALIGIATTLTVVVLSLPAIGLCASLLDNLGRIVLQRSADPRMLGPVFAVLDLVAGLGLVTGSGLALTFIAVSGAATAMIALGVVLLVVLAVAVRPLWLVDAEADVPVVEMSLLRGMPMFAPLTPLALEAVARTATPLAVPASTTVIRQGEDGGVFYAVVDGAFEIVMSGTHIRTARRGSFFGEVALLADVPRTASVTAIEAGDLLAIDRVPFLVAVTGSDTSLTAAWGVVRSLEIDVDLPLHEGPSGGRT